MMAFPMNCGESFAPRHVWQSTWRPTPCSHCDSKTGPFISVYGDDHLPLTPDTYWLYYFCSVPCLLEMMAEIQNEECYTECIGKWFRWPPQPPPGPNDPIII